VLTGKTALTRAMTRSVSTRGRAKGLTLRIHIVVNAEIAAARLPSISATYVASIWSVRCGKWRKG